MSDGLGFLGVRATWQLARSAMPDAPEASEPMREPVFPHRARRATARSLRWLAARVEPAVSAPRPVATP